MFNFVDNFFASLYVKSMKLKYVLEVTFICLCFQQDFCMCFIVCIDVCIKIWWV